MKILVLNQDWFVDEWRAAGHEVHTAGLSEHLEVVLETAHVHIDKVIERMPGGFNPDLIIYHDNSGPNIYAGLEDTDIPVIFYSVDTHHHHGTHRYFAHLFDYTLIAQKDYLSHFHEVDSDAEWLPLWASRYVEPNPNKEYGAVFVGNLNPELNKQRVWFFNELQKIVPVLTKIGIWWDIFPVSEIVINQTVKGDLNFRVFEAMVTGSMLLTEETQNGLPELFNSGEHLITYQAGYPENAAELIRYYLENKKLAVEIGMAGREEILKKHTAQHRAERFLELMPQVKKKQSSRKMYSALMGYCTLGFKSEKLDTAVATKAYISAMKALDMGLRGQEVMDSQLACSCVFACYKYDQYIGGRVGQDMLNRLREAYTNEPVLKVAALRNYLNQGQYELAKELATAISTEPVGTTFLRSEHLVLMILEGNSFAI